MLMILGMAGSLRRGSYNKAALRVALQEVPPEARMEIFDLARIPLYNQDIEKPLPPVVKEFKDKIRGADAILIATPEYNYSVSGVLKNAIDWGSRPYEDNSWGRKPVAIMSASPGKLGGARAQYHLRQTFVTLNMLPVNRPEVMIARANKKFDEQGNLTDEETRVRIRKLVKALIEWTKRIGNVP